MRAESGINPLDIKQKLYQQVAVRKKHLSLLQIFDRVAFDSFYFSQGSVDLQQLLLQCVAILYHDHPSKNQVSSWNAGDIRKTAYSVNRRIITFLWNHNTHTNLTTGDIKMNKSDVMEETLNAIDSYYRCFQDASNPDDFDFYTSLVMEWVTQQDLKHLLNPGGRRREGKIRRGKFHPYLSHLKHYAIDRNSTGNPEYDLIFIRIGEQLQERLQSDEDVLSNLSIEELQKKSEKIELLFGDSLSALMQIWENIHPGEKFIPEQWKMPTD